LFFVWIAVGFPGDIFKVVGLLIAVYEMFLFVHHSQFPASGFEFQIVLGHSAQSVGFVYVWFLFVVFKF